MILTIILNQDKFKTISYWIFNQINKTCPLPKYCNHGIFLDLIDVFVSKYFCREFIEIQLLNVILFVFLWALKQLINLNLSIYLIAFNPSSFDPSLLWQVTVWAVWIATQWCEAKKTRLFRLQIINKYLVKTSLLAV